MNLSSVSGWARATFCLGMLVFAAHAAGCGEGQATGAGGSGASGAGTSQGGNGNGGEGAGNSGGAGTGGSGGNGGSGTGGSGNSGGSGSGGNGGSGTGGSGTGGSGTGGNGTGGNGTGGNGTGGNGTGGSGGNGGAGGGIQGLPDVGSLVVLGDSISDGGGQSPFYYNLLKTDLETKYGTIQYQKKAQSGSKTSALVSQINSLPSSLAGPVAVVITSGGNDMKAALPQILLGVDATQKMAMSQNVKAALDLLLTPNKFGSGVEVYVFEGNIYDASDGAGDYGSNGCAFGQGLPAIPTDDFFSAWNGVITTQVEAHGQTLADMHTHFYGHGYKANPNWYAGDCTHPSSVGHDQLRRLFYQKITGESLP